MGVLRGRIAVLGLGDSGLAASRYVLERAACGDPVSLSVYDSADTDVLAVRARELTDAGARVFLGAHSITEDADLAVASPGIPPASLLIASAREKAGRLISELEFAFERSRCRWVAVTGTNGKTTVTSLVTHLLREAGTPCASVGNIGTPAIAAVEAAGTATVLVAEVSSFQLALTEAFHPQVSVLLNVTPDHLDWHGSMAAYAADKMRVFQNQDSGDTAVIDVDDPGSALSVADVEARGVHVRRVSRASVPEGGAGLSEGMLCLDEPAGLVELIPAADLLVRGMHNVSNALAGAAAARACGVGTEALRKGLRTFGPISHRLETVGVVAGVEYIDDSKATNPGAVIMALTAFPGKRVVLLAGGRSKGTPFAEMAVRAGESCRAVIAFGEAGEQVALEMRAAGVEVQRVPTMAEAVEAGAGLAETGDVVLLSPGCASFDEFTGYAERGRAFAAAVMAMDEGGTL